MAKGFYAGSKGKHLSVVHLEKKQKKTVQYTSAGIALLHQPFQYNTLRL
jgi:hypothetical protein